MNAIEILKQRIHGFNPKIEGNDHDAAVALILYNIFDQLNVLVIERSKISGDPWSGQLAFPGGHVESSDKDLIATAIRETTEETGIILENLDCIGRLSDEIGTLKKIKVASFVFFINEVQEPKTNDEVHHIFWCPLNRIYDPTHQRIHIENGKRMPAVDILGKEQPLLWGLTYRFINQLLSLIDKPLPKHATFKESTF